jgi:hypothetical protein
LNMKKKLKKILQQKSNYMNKQQILKVHKQWTISYDFLKEEEELRRILWITIDLYRRAAKLGSARTTINHEFCFDERIRAECDLVKAVELYQEELN